VAAGCEGKQPGELGCDGEKRIRCGADLLGSTLLDTCASAEVCQKSTGEKCVSCVAGDYLCAGEKLLRCNDSGGVDPVVACASAALCDADKGECKPPACDKEQAVCQGDLLRTCLPDQTGFDAGTTCEAGLCDAAGKQCDVCKAGEVSCTSDTERQTCSADGQKSEKSACPANLPWCTGAGQCAACTKDEHCPAPANECQQALCVGNTCTVQDRPDGTPSSKQTANDCKKNLCAGGKVVTEADAEDLPVDDGNPCTVESCNGTQPAKTNAADGAKCPAGACLGGQCNSNPSCTDQLTDYTCGAAENTNCCLAKEVPGGSFARGYDASTDPTSIIGRQNDPTAVATLSSFHLEVFEVSVRRFRKFVDAYPLGLPAEGDGAGGGFPGWKASWKSLMPATSAALKGALAACPDTTWSEVDGGPSEGRPVNCVTWYEAVAFCLWDGARLPSEAQWNYAAAGGDQQRAYPWSSPPSSVSIDETRASYYVDNNKFCFGDKKPGCSGDDLVQTGSFPAGLGRWGHFDLSGNVGEWVLDSLVEISKYPDGDCNDCVIHTEATQAITRGGGYDGQKEQLRTAYRFGVQRTLRQNRLGFRCVRP
jgi:formylglycine-generating enzyme required for sulfatase activity